MYVVGMLYGGSVRVQGAQVIEKVDNDVEQGSGACIECGVA